MKFILLQDYAPTEVAPEAIWNWAPDDAEAHIEFQRGMNDRLTESGELVEAQALAAPELAKVVVHDGVGAPVVTDGPFPEAKELLAGYRIVDVDSPERALEIAAEASAAPGPGGMPIKTPIEVREMMGAPAPGGVSPPRDIEGLLREAAPQVLAVIVRRFGDFSDSEDAVQEAMVAATQQWPRQGTPENPVGWLVHVASRRMIDQARSEAARRDREALASAREPRDPQPVADHDDTLALMFMSCHPELNPASAIALTLRAVGGLTTTEIANAFLVPEATMAQRISRAKQTIRASAIPFRTPSGDEWARRLHSVLHVLYLIFNEGYLTSGGSELARSELSGEAIRLGRIVRRALPDDPEVAGLLALMLLNEARRQARTGPNGELIPLAEQDRSLWDPDLIAEGLALVSGAWRTGSVGEYLVQAQIAALHDQAPGVKDTDWREIAALYGLLERMTSNPMVSLNRAIAVAMADGPQAGLALLEPLSEPLARNHRLHAARAHLLELAGEVDAAIAEYETAARQTTSIPEQNYLTMRMARLNERRTGAR